MDDRGEPQRIEIELTERAPARSGRRHRRDRTAPDPVGAPVAGAGDREPSAEPPPTAAGDWSRAATQALAAPRRPSFYYPDSEPDHGDDQRVDVQHGSVVTSDPDQVGGGPLATERGRLIAVAVTAGVVALLVGWGLGRSGDDGGSARTVDATTNVRTATTVAVTVLPGEPVPAAETPRPATPATTTRTWRTTTTSTVPPEWEESTVAIDPRLAGTTDRIVAVTDDAELLEVDLATGAVRTVAVQRWATSGSNPLPPIAGDGFVAVTFDNGAAPDVFVGDDPTPQRQSTADPWATYWDTASETMWTLVYEDAAGRPSQLTETTFDGMPTGRTIDLAGMWPSGLLDPRGGIVVGDGTIGTWGVSPEGSDRLPGGRIIALGVSHVLVYRCGDTLGDCSIAVVDRDTGVARRVPLGRAAVDRLLNGWWGGPLAGATVTSDGRSVLVPLPDDRGNPVVAVLDTVGGKIVEMASVGPSIQSGSFTLPSASWSTDERFAFVVDDGAVTAYDRESGVLFPVSSQLPSVRSLTIRLQP